MGILFQIIIISSELIVVFLRLSRIFYAKTSRFIVIPFFFVFIRQAPSNGRHRTRKNPRFRIGKIGTEVFLTVLYIKTKLVFISIFKIILRCQVNKLSHAVHRPRVSVRNGADSMRHRVDRFRVSEAVEGAATFQAGINTRWPPAVFTEVEITVFRRAESSRWYAEGTSRLFRHARNNINNAAHGIRPVQRAGRPANNFNTVNITDIESLQCIDVRRIGCVFTGNTLAVNKNQGVIRTHTAELHRVSRHTRFR